LLGNQLKNALIIFYPQELTELAIEESRDGHYGGTSK